MTNVSLNGPLRLLSTRGSQNKLTNIPNPQIKPRDFIEDPKSNDVYSAYLESREKEIADPELAQKIIDNSIKENKKQNKNALFSYVFGVGLLAVLVTLFYFIFRSK